MVADPQGAPIYVMKPTPPPDRAGERSTAFSRTAVGHCGWNELATPDPDKAFGFYTGQFGWTDGGSIPWVRWAITASSMTERDDRRRHEERRQPAADVDVRLPRGRYRRREVEG